MTRKTPAKHEILPCRFLGSGGILASSEVIKKPIQDSDDYIIVLKHVNESKRVELSPQVLGFLTEYHHAVIAEHARRMLGTTNT